MDWYFTQKNENCRLSTDAKSRGATFYRMQGWNAIGNYKKKLEMSFELQIKKSRNQKITALQLYLILKLNRSVGIKIFKLFRYCI